MTALRAIILDGLGEAADNRRSSHRPCRDCTRHGPCPDRAADLAAADAFDGAAALIRRITGDHWIISVLRGETTTTRGTA
jgi:hypothetical protein